MLQLQILSLCTIRRPEDGPVPRDCQEDKVRTPHPRRNWRQSSECIPELVDKHLPCIKQINSSKFNIVKMLKRSHHGVFIVRSPILVVKSHDPVKRRLEWQTVYF